MAEGLVGRGSQTAEGLGRPLGAINRDPVTCDLLALPDFVYWLFDTREPEHPTWLEASVLGVNPSNMAARPTDAERSEEWEIAFNRAVDRSLRQLGRAV
jgi:hypothetical protein